MNKTPNADRITMRAGALKPNPGAVKGHSSVVSDIFTLIQSEMRTVMEEACETKRKNGTSCIKTLSAVFLSALVIAYLALPGIAAADTAGPSYPSAGANNTTAGTRSWSNPGNIVSSNNSNASASMSRTEISNYIVASGFGFAIPAGATINGISVSVERREGNAVSSVYIRDSSIMIVKGGTVTGTNHAATTTNWPTADATATYGSASDLWGTTWTAADINATNFGVALSAAGYASSGTSRETAYIDGVTITVTYTPAASCTANAATVTLTPASQTITVNGGSASYSATITNNDSGSGCSPVTYTLAAADSNSTNFNASTLGSSSVTLAAGAASSAVALTVSARTGQTTGTDATTVTASATGHTNGSSSVSTTLNVASSCTAAAPTLQVDPATQTVTPSGTASYTVSVTNNDSVACSSATFNLSAADSNSTDFTTPSTLSATSLPLSPGQTGTSTLSTIARATAANSASNTATVAVSATGHTAPANVTATTTVSVSSSGTSSLLHNSVSTGSAKWSAQGGWGVAGGMYGSFGCETCHIKGAVNIKGVKQTITVPDTTKGNIPGSSVIFTRVSGTAARYTAGQGVFGDDTSCSNAAYTDQTTCAANGGTWAARSQSDRVCEVCHTITSYHRFNTAATATTAAQTAYNHNNAVDCIGCHPHNQGFKGSGDCYVCHSSAQAGVRRAVVSDSTGGDFRKTSHHVTNGTTTQLVNKDVCLVCHGDLLADKGHPGTHSADPAVELKDPDTGAYVATDEAGIELVCSKCHDANGATRTGLPAGASATQPFNLTSMAVKDANTPPNIGWTAGQQAHSYTAANGAGGCLACHGNAAAAGTTLDPKKNAHGSDQYKMMQFAYSTAIAAYPVNNTSNFCFNCHGATAANGTTNNVGADFAKTYGHKTVTCYDCHDQHEAKTGLHTAGTSTLPGVLNGAAGKGVTTWNAATWGGVTTYAATATAAAEWQVCFKCHSGTSLPAGTGAAAFTDLGLEFNPNNASGHPIVLGLNSYPNSAAPKALTAAKMKAPWTNVGAQTMTCSDCHATDNTASKGPHGSAVKWMLAGTNRAWPYTAASANGTQTGTLFRIATYSTGNGTVNGLFCLNCHTVTGTNNWHSNTNVTGGQHGSNNIMACANCHIRVPHGGKIARLLQTTNAPARYKANAGGTALGTFDFWGGSTGIKGSTVGSSTFNSSCSQHNSGTGEAW